jgi:hypothetical protein
MIAYATVAENFPDACQLLPLRPKSTTSVFVAADGV